MYTAKTVLLLTAAAIFVLFQCSSSTKTGTGDTPAEPAATVAATGPAPAYAEIAAKREGATDVQWDAYAATLAGLQATDWPALVTEVTGKPGDYEVKVDLDNNADFSIQDATIETADEGVAAFGKGARVLVSGVIEEVRSPMGMIVVEFADGATVVAAP